MLGGKNFFESQNVLKISSIVCLFASFFKWFVSNYVFTKNVNTPANGLSESPQSDTYSQMKINIKVTLESH